MPRNLPKGLKAGLEGRTMYEKLYFVYLLTNKNNNVFYTGVTSDLVKRVFEHKSKAVDGFSKRYNLNKLVYYEIFNDIEAAIKKEKQIKNWHREWKINKIKEKIQSLKICIMI